MDQKTRSSILSFNNNPLMNAFYTNDKKKYKFITVNGGKSVINNSSFFFSKANFIKMSSKQVNNDKINRIYREIDVDDKFRHVVCYEVFTNTGIICSFLPTAKPSNPIKIPGIEKIEQYLTELFDELSLEDILDKIAEATNFDNIEEFFNQLLEKLVKSENQ
jgi:hypothetical protein